jgi:hypothetical protein
MGFLCAILWCFTRVVCWGLAEILDADPPPPRKDMAQKIIYKDKYFFFNRPILGGGGGGVSVSRIIICVFSIRRVISRV